MNASPRKTLVVKVLPGARRTEIVGWEGYVLKVKVTAPPEKGEANEAVRELLASHFNIPKRECLLIRGSKSRLKFFSIPEASKLFP